MRGDNFCKTVGVFMAIYSVSFYFIVFHFETGLPGPMFLNISERVSNKRAALSH